MLNSVELLKGNVEVRGVFVERPEEISLAVGEASWKLKRLIETIP